VTSLVREEWHQLSLLEDPRRDMREEKLTAALDALKACYGKDVVRRAGSVRKTQW